MASTTVYTGPWIDWSHGPIFGPTITLPTKGAAFLTAFLAVYVTTAGHAFWTLCSFFFHQLGAGETRRDAVHYQQQAILRNAGGALGTAWKLCRLSFAWRHHQKLPHARSLLLTIVALAAAGIFAAAGLFSSQVTKAAASDVLIRSGQCGSWSFPTSAQGTFQWQLKNLNETLTAASYARQCYGSSGQNLLHCNTYTRPQLTWTRDKNASCPFASGACVFSDTAAYQMDTGYMDSHEILGVNAPHHQRVAFRRVSTCAPLHMKQYAKLENDTVDEGTLTETYIRLYLGPIVQDKNFTYQYDTREFYMNMGYDVSAIFADAGLGNGWIPVHAFNRTDADVSMFFIAANAFTYDAPVDMSHERSVRSAPHTSVAVLLAKELAFGSHITFYIKELFSFLI